MVNHAKNIITIGNSPSASATTNGDDA